MGEIKFKTANGLSMAVKKKHIDEIIRSLTDPHYLAIVVRGAKIEIPREYHEKVIKQLHHVQ